MRQRPKLRKNPLIPVVSRHPGVAGEVFEDPFYPRYRNWALLIIAGNAFISPKEIKEHIDHPSVKLPKISYHVKILLKRGMIVVHHRSPRRGATETYYQITDLGWELYELIKTNDPKSFAVFIADDPVES